MKVAAIVVSLTLLVCQVDCESPPENEPLLDSPKAVDVGTIDLLDVISNTTQPDVAHKVEVYLMLEQVWSNANVAAQLFCDYSISSGDDLPVTVTWKVGDGPRYAKDVYRCTGYTHQDKQCTTSQVLDDEYAGRVRLGATRPSLEITKVRVSDNRNYWCQVSLDDNSNVELGFDMKSVVLRVNGGGEMPKMHSVEVDEDIVASAGGEVTIECVCEGSYCNDVHWYKGPSDSAGQSYDLVYTRISGSRPIPTQYTAYNDWIDRATLSGNSLIISDLHMSDEGRYWCEMKPVGYYGIGEWATDAESVVLEVLPSKSDDAEPFDCIEKADGLYQDPSSCGTYFECVAGRPYNRQCPQGTIFNSASLPDVVCDFAYNVSPPCGSKTTIN